MKTLSKLTPFLLALVFLFVACDDDNEDDPVQPVEPTVELGEVEVIFTPQIGDNTLKMGEEITTPAGEQLTINEFKFYVSKLAMVKKDADEVEVTPLEGAQEQVGVWLIDFTNPNMDMGSGNHSYAFKFKVPAEEYADIRYEVAVPREYNLADVTTNPYPMNGTNGMYWSWNSGFKFLVINGSSPVVGQAPNNAVHLSIGLGHRAVDYNFRSMVLASDREGIKVEAGKTTRIYFEYDVNNLLIGPDGTPYSFQFVPGKPNPAQVHGGVLSDQLKTSSVSAIELTGHEMM